MRPGGTAKLGEREVARVGYGAMQLREEGPDDGPVAVLRRARELGVDHLDTAEFYGDGVVNRRIRAALGPDDDVVVATKVGAEPASGVIDLRLAQRPEQLRAQVEANLRSLGAERLDVVNLRRADAPPGLVAEGDQVVDLDDQLAVLTALRDAGTIGAIGLSQVSADQLRRALPVGIVCVQNAYSLVDRSSEPVLDLCREHGIAWVPYFPLGSGFAGQTHVTTLPSVRSVADRIGATPSQVGLAWVLSRSPGSMVIPGTRSVGHLEENVGAGSVSLSAEDLATLDA
ncbi:aldo/keto reductase [Actinomycetospora corticicola]|uniref:Aryl-alcohol dehydrogenase-like predicted oxidoreductase n=1 Tax=Actinomycetospora corticicola TaxID=663602 RepID=A0A7Y9DRP1_9PSEU|nr:aldo/keto reductase [Actinomycetospora corticicola]NYD34256.1 aryl-alcohol dehydrogenase-like predicted oxidoreductase [Actinomycetospora corticicola]